MACTPPLTKHLSDQVGAHPPKKMDFCGSWFLEPRFFAHKIRMLCGTWCWHAKRNGRVEYWRDVSFLKKKIQQKKQDSSGMPQFQNEVGEGLCKVCSKMVCWRSILNLIFLWHRKWWVSTTPEKNPRQHGKSSTVTFPTRKTIMFVAICGSLFILTFDQNLGYLLFVIDYTTQ